MTTTTGLDKENILKAILDISAPKCILWVLSEIASVRGSQTVCVIYTFVQKSSQVLASIII